MSGDWSDSLFSSDKGDSLGDGSWGKPAEDDPALAPVDWAQLPNAPDPGKRKPRARLATPAPGSQKGSGLLDIKALAGAMKAEADNNPAVSARKPTPAPVPRARLATAAKGSTGSGLIDVAEIVRQTEAQALAAEASGTAHAASEGGTPSPSLSSASLSGMHVDADLDDELVAGSGGRTMLYVLVAVLALAVAGLAAFVLTRS